MESFIADKGYLLLFLASFISATVIPLGSEWLLVSMIMGGSNMALCIAVASSGNYLGGLTTYLIGLYGSSWITGKVLKIDGAQEERARHIYARYGAWSLLFSWLPVIGDPLCLMGGVMKTGFIRFTLLVFTGKLARYSILAWLTREGMELAVI